MSIRQQFAKTGSPGSVSPKKHPILHRLIMDRWLYIMLTPGVIYFLLFKYGPMWGILLAFKNYQPFLGFFGSEWVGLEHFERFFSGKTFWMLFRNTLSISALNILLCFPLPILVALLLNEVQVSWYKRMVQTVSYVPHFMSWVVVASMTYILFTTENGLVNNVIKALGGKEVNFLMSERWFLPMIIGQNIWKGTGWGTIIYLAALTGVDSQLYEAARIDGASRLRQAISITLPSIRPTVVTMLILKLGDVLDTGFDQIYLMLNAMNRNVGEVFDTYVYTTGIGQGQFSYSIAVNLFKSLVGLILVFTANAIAQKLGEEGIF